MACFCNAYQFCPVPHSNWSWEHGIFMSRHVQRTLLLWLTHSNTAIQSRGWIARNSAIAWCHMWCLLSVKVHLLLETGADGWSVTSAGLLSSLVTKSMHGECYHCWTWTTNCLLVCKQEKICKQACNTRRTTHTCTLLIVVCATTEGNEKHVCKQRNWRTVFVQRWSKGAFITFVSLQQLAARLGKDFMCHCCCNASVLKPIIKTTQQKSLRIPWRI